MRGEGLQDGGCARFKASPVCPLDSPRRRLPSRARLLGLWLSLDGCERPRTASQWSLMSLQPGHNAVEARCLAVIASTTNPELRKTAERMLANGGRRPRELGRASNPAPPAAKKTASDTASADPEQTAVARESPDSASSWSCTTCTMLNDESAKVCVACNRRRSSALPAAKGAASKRPRCEAPTWVSNDDDNDDDFV